ncbi:hypothetical protein PAXRUDRAFT_152703, partial [Paxillus rubicundulus Ve08.2h10]
SAQKQLEYLTRIAQYDPQRLVFVDESSIDCHKTYCGHAWSIQGTKVQCK